MAWLAAVILLGGFITGMAVQWRTGLADNGDFTRAIKFFSPGPVGIRPNFPPVGSELWHRRFFTDWLPDWTLERHHEKIITSAVLLWLPGVWLGRAAGLSAVSLPWLSLVPRLLLLAELSLLVRWALAQPAGRWLPWTLGAPVVLLLTTTDNASFLNSFYQEAALQVFILPVLFALVALRTQPTWARLALAVSGVALLTTAKSSTLYWAAAHAALRAARLDRPAARGRQRAFYDNAPHRPRAGRGADVRGANGHVVPGGERQSLP